MDAVRFEDAVQGLGLKWKPRDASDVYREIC